MENGKLRGLEFRQIRGFLSQGNVLQGGMSWILGSSESKGCVADMPRLSPGSTAQQCDLGQVT